MKYQFKYRTTAFDLWRLSMYSIYGSMLASVNIIFTIAMFLLAFKFWGSVNPGLKVLLVLGMSLFTVIQPLLLYYKSRKQVANVREVSIGFGLDGVHVETGGQVSDMKWKAIKGIARKPGMVVLYSTGGQGYILTDKVMADKKVKFFDYVSAMIS